MAGEQEPVVQLCYQLLFPSYPTHSTKMLQWDWYSYIIDFLFLNFAAYHSVLFTVVSLDSRSHGLPFTCIQGFQFKPFQHINILTCWSCPPVLYKQTTDNIATLTRRSGPVQHISKKGPGQGPHCDSLLIAQWAVASRTPTNYCSLHLGIKDWSWISPRIGSAIPILARQLRSVLQNYFGGIGPVCNRHG